MTFRQFLSKMFEKWSHQHEFKLKRKMILEDYYAVGYDLGGVKYNPAERHVYLCKCGKLKTIVY